MNACICHPQRFPFQKNPGKPLACLLVESSFGWVIDNGTQMETDHSTPQILGQPRHIHGKLHTITQSNTEATKGRPSDLDSPGVKKRLEPRLGRFDPGQHLIKLMFLDCRQLAAKERAFQRFPLPPVLAGRSKAPAIAQCFAELLCGESDPTCLFQLLPNAHCKHQTEGWFLVN